MLMLLNIRLGILICVLLISSLEYGNARHIIGGELYYETLSPGNYEFTLIVYRDCAGGGAFFDSQSSTTGTVTIFRSDLDIPYDRVILDEPVIEPIEDELERTCYNAPSSLCVERGVYKFQSRLRISEHTYTISYQRCCRNSTINNIVDPDASGATYTIDIPPLAQKKGNSSIRFSNFPPTVICSQYPLNFNHSAFAPDEPNGSRIEYEFCSPFLGGGDVGTASNPGSTTGPNGVAPDPDLPPPYKHVNFVGGEYTSNTPMGGDPVISINSETGIITGTPQNLGQFVVGICATEYDSLGNVLSRIRRDFQFNVVECDDSVTAFLIADSIDERGNFVINACGRSKVQFLDSSYLKEFVSTYEWTFEVENGADLVSTEENPVIDFPDFGSYPGRLILNENSICPDTADFFVNIFGEIENDFSIDYDTCTAGSIAFEGVFSTENNEIIQRNWNLNNEASYNGGRVDHEFRTPGEKLIRFEVVDDKGCAAVREKIIPYYPIPKEIQIETEAIGECQPLKIYFANFSYPLNETYDVTWEFGDGSTSSMISPANIYEEAGIYSVFLEIISPIGCKYSGEVEQGIVVLESPNAEFTYSPRSFDQINNTAHFRDLSRLADQWDWEFGDFGISNQRNPSFSFPDTGVTEVELMVTHVNGCTDTVLQLIDIVPNPVYFLPNAFRPSGRNPIYKGAGALSLISQFEMNIYDRWGGKIFTSSDPDVGWNGRRNNTGNMMPAGVYICQVRFVGPRGKTYQFKEFATLIN